MKLKRAVQTIFAVGAGGWFLTLGVFSETHSTSCLSSKANVRFGDGVLTVGAYQGVGKEATWGIPYVYHRSYEIVPFNLTLVVNSVQYLNSVDAISSVICEKVEIFCGTESSTFNGIDMGTGDVIEVQSTVSANFSKTLQNAVRRKGGAKVRIAGVVLFDSGKRNTFDVELNVPYCEESRYYPGWVKLMYYNHF